MASLKQRGKIYYALYYNGKQKHRVSLQTTSLQVAKEKIRELESSLYRGDQNPLPTKTPLEKILDRYVEYMESFKTAKSVQTDVYYLRSMFGPCCEALKITARKRSPRAKKKPGVKIDKRVKPKTIEAKYLEEITTAQISDFISTQVRIRGLAPKTANRYREILHRLFNWAMNEAGVRIRDKAS
jgi:hypothetical protein